jgi:predicted nucleotidyltransferase
MIELTCDVDRLAAVAEELGLELVVLFGSRATGSPPPTLDSDVDIALLTRPGTAARGLADAYAALDGLFGDVDLDLVLLHRADPLFRDEIMRRGVLLFGDVDRFLDYRAAAFRAFTDARDLLELEGLLFERKMARIARALDADAA